MVICAVALLASGVTFFSGFGLGTLLLPAFALFFAIEQAVVLTAIVHFLNGVFKLALVWRHVDRAVAVRFGLPAIFGALAGAWILMFLSGTAPIASYSLFGRAAQITAPKLIIGFLLFVFACAEMSTRFQRISFGPRFQPLGGALSGFFGGLAGMQGALRSAFLIKAGLSKEAYVATGAAIAFFIDVSRLSVYWSLIVEEGAQRDYRLVAAAVFAALLGSILGNRYLPKVTLNQVRILVATMLFIVSLGLIVGLL
ncbi:MAG: TSUP family transporter [Betaproteobacteria bacterium]